MTAPLSSDELDEIERVVTLARQKSLNADDWQITDVRTLFSLIERLISAARDGLRWREHVAVAMRNDPNWRQNMMPLDATAPGDASSGEGGDER